MHQKEQIQSHVREAMVLNKHSRANSRLHLETHFYFVFLLRLIFKSLEFSTEVKKSVLDITIHLPYLHLWHVAGHYSDKHSLRKKY